MGSTRDKQPPLPSRYYSHNRVRRRGTGRSLITRIQRQLGYSARDLSGHGPEARELRRKARREALDVIAAEKLLHMVQWDSGDHGEAPERYEERAHRKRVRDIDNETARILRVADYLGD